MKSLRGKKLYAATIPAIFITVIFTGRLMQVNGETLPYRDLVMLSAIIALTIFLLLEKNRHRKNYLAFVSGAASQMPPFPSSGLVLTNTKAKQQLVDTKERYRLLIQNSTDIITLVDGNGIIMYQSPALEKITGYAAGELDGKNIFDFIHPEDVNEVSRALLYGIFKEGKTSPLISHRFHHKNGSWVSIESQGTSHLNMRGINGIIINSRDVTERMETEAKLRHQFKELQKTNYELDRFVYSVSHDLRAPLTSIMGIINLAELEHQTEQQKRYLDMIQFSVNRLDSFIKHILSYSRNNKSEVTSEPIDFRELLSEVRANLKFVAGTEHMKIKANIDQNIPFRSDRMRLMIILNNLFSNAIKYRDIHKNDSYLSLDIVTTENEARITVEDNGIGIDKKHLNKIFKMFYRVSSIAPGAGLGLYIVKEVTHKLGGDIKADSIPGQKTVFAITIPNK